MIHAAGTTNKSTKLPLSHCYSYVAILLDASEKFSSR
jgi:hypothetical protein